MMVGAPMRWPSMYVPLALPVSSMTTDSPFTVTLACCRETPPSASTRSHPSARPMDMSPDRVTSRSFPSGLRTTRIGMGVLDLLLPEDAHVHRDTPALELIIEPRHESGGHEPAADPPVVHEALLLEVEDVLEGDDVHLHPGQLGDEAHLPGAVREPHLLDDHVHRGGDLLADGLDRQVHPRHQHHGLQPGDGVARGVGVERGERPVVA